MVTKDHWEGDQCHITGKYRGSAHGDCHIKVKIIVKFLSYSTN